MLEGIRRGATSKSWVSGRSHESCQRTSGAPTSPDSSFDPRLFVFSTWYSPRSDGSDARCGRCVAAHRADDDVAVDNVFRLLCRPLREPIERTTNARSALGALPKSIRARLAVYENLRTGEPELALVPGLLGSRGALVDVGANNGPYASLAAQLGRHVVASSRTRRWQPGFAGCSVRVARSTRSPCPTRKAPWCSLHASTRERGRSAPAVRSRRARTTISSDSRSGVVPCHADIRLIIFTTP